MWDSLGVLGLRVGAVLARGRGGVGTSPPSTVTVLQRGSTEDEQPLPVSLARLVGFIALGTAAASLVLYVLGRVVVSTALDLVG
ncbi:MAG: hypothetical protein ACXWX0_08405 [Actinomycetota bacterium]